MALDDGSDLGLPHSREDLPVRPQEIKLIRYYENKRNDNSDFDADGVNGDGCSN